MLNELPRDVAELLTGACRRRRYAANDAILHAGDEGGCVHLISRGHVAIIVNTPLGHQLAFSILGPQQSFGELSVLSSGVRTATARALDPTETLALQGPDLHRLRRQHPEVNDALLRLLCAQVVRLSSRLAEHLYLPVNARIRRRLLDLCAVYGNATGRWVVPLKQDVLAELSGATRPTVNHVLKRDEAAGIIAVARRQITVLDLEALGRLAQLDRD